MIHCMNKSYRSSIGGVALSETDRLLFLIPAVYLENVHQPTSSCLIELASRVRWLASASKQPWGGYNGAAAG